MSEVYQDMSANCNVSEVRTIDQNMSEAREVSIEVGPDTARKLSKRVAQLPQFTRAYSLGRIRLSKLGKTGSSV